MFKGKKIIYCFWAICWLLSSSLTCIANIPNKNIEPNETNPILIFVSLAMPQPSLIQWFIQAKKINGPIFIRGLIDNSFKETQINVTSLAEDSNNGVILDPRIFEQYDITEVPAVVIHNTSISCLPNQSCSQMPPFNVVLGDMGLDTALSLVANDNDCEKL